MIRTIETNKVNIKENERRIQENKVSIEEMKTELRWHSMEAGARLERIIHKLIILLVIAVALLFVSNALWIYAWNSSDKSLNINNENVVGSEIGGEK